MKTDSFRVYLRAFEPDDYLTTVKWHNDNEIWGMVGSPKYFVSHEYEKKWIEDAIWSKAQIKLGICLKENDKLIGFGAVTDMDWINRSAHCPSMIGEKEYWGKGLASEARILLLDFAFCERGLNRVNVLILEGNTASLKICEKCGFQVEGVLRQSIFKQGRFHNQVVMSLLQEEFYAMFRDRGLG